MDWTLNAGYSSMRIWTNRQTDGKNNLLAGMGFPKTQTARGQFLMALALALIHSGLRTGLDLEILVMIVDQFQSYGNSLTS